MTTAALNDFFALLETEEEDFAALVKRFGIDPAKDFQNCDLSNVDFGRLAVDTLDLSGSILDGANLSQVQYRELIGCDGPITARRETSLLDDVRAAVLRYQNSDWVLNQVLQRLSDSSAPILAFYDSTTEQDILTKRLCSHFTKHLIRSAPDPMMSRFLWFYTKANKSQQLRLNPASLEKAFFELLRVGSISHDVGIYPFVSNQAAVERVCKSASSGSFDRMRSQFAKSLRRELGTMRRIGEAFDPGAVVLFSGFPPISKRLYKDIREAGNGSLTLIFLCSSNLEPIYEEGGGMLWRRIAVPAYSIGEPLTVTEDIGRIKRRVGVATAGRVFISDNTEAWMRQYVGKPLRTLKMEVINKLKGKIGAVTKLGTLSL